jgi:hypothetical protein
LLKDSEVSLRIRVHDDKLLVETRNEDEDGDWQSLAEFPRSGYPGDPVSVRLGKSHGVEGSDDHTAPGDAGVSEFSSLRVFVR